MYIQLNTDAVIQRLVGCSLSDIPQANTETTKPKPKPIDYYLAAANLILERSLQYVPVDTGKLRDSAYIKPFGKGFEVGYTCDYALYVHEIGFNYHEPPTQYKFLEDAAEEVTNEIFDETGMSIPVNIEYNPLRVFVGDYDAPGEELHSIKTVERMLQDPDMLEHIWQGYINYDPNTASDFEKVHYQKMEAFFDYYYHIRGHNSWNILSEWADRSRHS